MPSFSLFDHASTALLEWIKSAGSSRTLAGGSTLIREGKASECLFVLLNGSLTVTTTNRQELQDQLATLSPGSLVGEMSWLEQRPAVATVTAPEDSTVLELPVRQLERFVEDSPALAAELNQLIAQKLAVQIQEQNAWVHRLTNATAPVEALRKVLVLFAQLHEQDVHRLALLGQVEKLLPDTVLLHQGEPVPALYLVLSGEAEILLNLSGTTQMVGSSRRGELLGEMSLLQRKQDGAAASVHTAAGMDVLAIDIQQLQAALAQDPKLASRFYRGLACMLSQRSRDQLLSHQRAAASQQAELDAIDRLDLGELAAISRGARHFDWLCRHFQTGEAVSA
ncbi:hypothetical protein KR52_03425 [Synechococcus sp. KORDI-52]|uniref:cyclic nucleotide-binding domain-containing protein n=1 Tax=Synechococcus sp. KORDI-52 TaxID=585425 RepID=UPI0004E03064|nr:cyclic nucleotide-binding domain-containing protein [Synechococcus sp. KORDI-52]AII48208.1 hypothetical protein KR52_03425 [Synechococcus sp. KORDI-52]